MQKGVGPDKKETLFTVYNDGSTEPLEYMPLSNESDVQTYTNLQPIEDPNNPGSFIQQRVFVTRNKKTGVVSKPQVVDQGAVTQMATSEIVAILNAMNPDKPKATEQGNTQGLDRDFE